MALSLTKSQKLAAYQYVLDNLTDGSYSSYSSHINGGSNYICPLLTRWLKGNFTMIDIQPMTSEYHLSLFSEIAKLKPVETYTGSVWYPCNTAGFIARKHILSKVILLLTP